MTESVGRDGYVARCLRVASAAGQRGVQLQKLDKPPSIEVSKDGKAVTFPIVTDAQLWRETTVEEGFYAVLIDARGWAAADVSEGVEKTLTDEVQAEEVALVRKDFTEENARVAELTELLGGPDALAALYETADLA